MKGHPVGTLVRQDHPADDHFPGSSVWLRIVRWVPRVGSHGGWLCVTSAAPGNVLCEEWDGDLREGTKFEDMPVVGAIPGSDAERARVTEPTDLDPCYGNPVEQCTNPGHSLDRPILTGAQADDGLPRGSVVAFRYDFDRGHGFPRVKMRSGEWLPENVTTRLVPDADHVVLYTAPERKPARTLAVGDVIATGDELESLPLGAVVRDEGGLVGQRLSTGWAWVDPTQNEIGPYGKATVIDLPGGDEA